MIDGIISALSVLKDTPFAAIIGVAGILFILLAFVERIGGTSVFTSSQRIGALIVGFLLLVIGIFLSVYNPPSTSSPDEQSSSVLLFELNSPNSSVVTINSLVSSPYWERKSVMLLIHDLES